MRADRTDRTEVSRVGSCVSLSARTGVAVSRAVSLSRLGCVCVLCRDSRDRVCRLPCRCRVSVGAGRRRSVDWTLVRRLLTKLCAAAEYLRRSQHCVSPSHSHTLKSTTRTATHRGLHTIARTSTHRTQPSPTPQIREFAVCVPPGPRHRQAAAHSSLTMWIAGQPTEQPLPPHRQRVPRSTPGRSQPHSSRFVAGRRASARQPAPPAHAHTE